MKKLLMFFSLFSFFVLCNLLNAQEVPLGDSLYIQIKNQILFPYFRALRDGDVSTIKRCISEDMYKKNKALLEQNKDYPKFLRDFYRGARFRSDKAVEIDGNIIVDVVIEFQGSHRSLSKLRLCKERDGSQGNDKGESWRVREIITDGGFYRPENMPTTE